MTVFTWTKKDVEDILHDLKDLDTKHRSTKLSVIEDIQTILKAMLITGQEKIYAANRGNLVYLLGRNPEDV